MIFMLLVYGSAVLIGANALLTQLAVIRELSLLFTGNEIFLGISLAIWVAGTGLGSSRMLHSILPKTFCITPAFFGFLTIACVTLFPAMILLVRKYNHIFNTSGMDLGVGPMVLICLLFLLPAAILNGFWYSMLLLLIERFRPHSGSSIRFSADTVFAFEALGAGAVGIGYTFFWAAHWQPFSIASIWIPGCLIFSLLSILFFSSKCSLKPNKTIIFTTVLCICLFTSFKFFGIWHFSEFRTLQSFPFSGTQLINRFTPLGHIALTQQRGTYIYYYSGKPLYSFPNPQTNEPHAFLPFLLWPDATSVAVIGFNPDVIAFLTRISTLSTLDLYIEDPIAFRALQKTLPEPWRTAFHDKRINLNYGDPRQLLKNKSQNYDIVLLSSLSPTTLVSNRFFTGDFLKILHSHLSKQGIVLYSLGFSENRSRYIEHLIISTLIATIKKEFPHLRLFPTDQLYICASPSNPLEKISLFQLTTRFNNLRTSNWVYRPEQIPYLFDRNRADEIHRRFQPKPFQQTNNDQRPLISGFASLYWLSHQKGFATILTLSILSAGFILLTLSFWRNRINKHLFRMFMTGAVLMSMQLIIITTRQIRHGHLWVEIGLLLSSVMFGLALGGIAGNRLLRKLSFDSSLIALLFLAFLCAGGANAILVSNTLLMALTLLISGGFCAGWIYADITYGYTALDAADVWAADLAGSSIGALLTGTVLLPVLGPWSGLSIAGLLAITIIFIRRIKYNSIQL